MGGVLTGEEHRLPTESASEEAKWRFFVDGAIHRAVERMWHRVEVTVASTLANVRGPDPDYASQPVTAADLERMVQRIAREQGVVRVNNSGRSGPPKWLSKFFLGVGIILVASAITATATTVVLVASIRTRIEDYIKSNDQRVSRVEQETDDNTRRLDRGAGVIQ